MADAQKTTNSMVSWIALIVAVVALLLGWTAFNRSGQDVVPAARQQSQEAVEDAQLVAAQAEARTRLLALRANLAAEEGYQEAAQEAAEIRMDLDEAYADASAEARQEWRELESELEQFEQQARDESADAAETLAGLIALLGQDLRTDEQ